MSKRLNICTLAWIVLISVWQIRPDPIKQIFMGQRTSALIAQCAVIILPYVAFMLYSYLPTKLEKWGNKLAVFDIEWHIKLLPATLAVFFVLDVINAHHQFASNTFTSVGLGYVILLQAAYANRALGNIKALSVGATIGLATIYIWEVIYQLLIYYKADWNVYGNMTFFISAIIIFPFILLSFMSKIKVNPYFGASLLVFAVVTAIWLASRWTWVIYQNNVWTTEPFNRVQFALTRISKASLGLMLSTLVFTPLITKHDSVAPDFYDRQAQSINPIRRVWNQGRQKITRELVDKYHE